MRRIFSIKTPFLEQFPLTVQRLSTYYPLTVQCGGSGVLRSQPASLPRLRNTIVKYHFINKTEISLTLLLTSDPDALKEKPKHKTFRRLLLENSTSNIKYSIQTLKRECIYVLFNLLFSFLLVRLFNFGCNNLLK